MKRLLTLMLASIVSGVASADVTMPEIFGDHMVLQEGTAWVWGQADPGEDITVLCAGVTAHGVAGQEGRWKVELKGLKGADKSQVLSIAGKNRLQFNDVLLGDVWVAAGQSNMEISLDKLGRSLESESKNVDSRIRLFVVPFAPSVVPQNNFIPDPHMPHAGKWMVCTPETATHGFSAVGYYFGAELCRTQNKPIGMIACNRGGTGAQLWISGEGIAKYADPKSTPTLNKPFVKGDSSSCLFNGMVHPLIPFSIKGVIWYQGEANSWTMESSLQYATLFKRLILDWREQWASGEFPFYFVQLASFEALKKTKDHQITWPWLRESQAKALEVPNTRMATAIDLGNPQNIHPQNKYDVGLRLALLARQSTYGEKIVASGPVYKELKVEGNRIRISFDSVGGGLQILTPPLEGEEKPWSPESVLKGFEIAGSDQKWVSAKASLDGDSVLVEGVLNPVAVRYGWKNVSAGNLYNQARLPAYPFRTDHWKPDGAPDKAE